MELFKIAPFDQILRVESSLGASSILLRADNVTKYRVCAHPPKRQILVATVADLLRRPAACLVR